MCAYVCVYFFWKLNFLNIIKNENLVYIKVMLFFKFWGIMNNCKKDEDSEVEYGVVVYD